MPRPACGTAVTAVPADSEVCKHCQCHGHVIMTVQVAITRVDLSHDRHTRAECPARVAAGPGAADASLSRRHGRRPGRTPSRAESDPENAIRISFPGRARRPPLSESCPWPGLRLASESVRRDFKRFQGWPGRRPAAAALPPLEPRRGAHPPRPARFGVRPGPAGPIDPSQAVRSSNPSPVRNLGRPAATCVPAHVEGTAPGEERNRGCRPRDRGCRPTTVPITLRFRRCGEITLRFPAKSRRGRNRGPITAPPAQCTAYCRDPGLGSCGSACSLRASQAKAGIADALCICGSRPGTLGQSMRDAYTGVRGTARMCAVRWPRSPFTSASSGD